MPVLLDFAPRRATDDHPNALGAWLVYLLLEGLVAAAIVTIGLYL